MRFVLGLLMVTLTLSNCTSNRYVLSDSNSDKDFLKEQIKKFKKTERISNKPILVIDGKPYRYDYELKEKSLEISKSDIKEISILKREPAIKIYGDFAKGGVLIITTKTKEEAIHKSNENKGFDEKNILFIIDGKIVERSFVLSLDPNNIETVTVIKNREDIRDYTSEDYDGVVIIVTKKE